MHPDDTRSEDVGPPDLTMDDPPAPQDAPAPADGPAPAGDPNARTRSHWYVPPGTFPGNLYSFWLTLLSVLFGVVLRTREWLHDKSLWLDEISISENLMRRGFGELTRPLAGNQSAPIPWLWAERAAINTFGVHEL